MRWGKRHYHRESYLTRKRAASKRRLKAKLIPGYGKHRKYDFKQWQNRNYQRRYRRHTYPSQSERLRAWGEGYSRPRKRRYSRVFGPINQTSGPRRKANTKDSKHNQAQYQPLSHQTWENILGWSFTISVFGSLWQYGFYGFFAGFWWMFIFCIIVGWFIGVYKQAPGPETQSRGSKESRYIRTNVNNKPKSSSQSSARQKSIASAKPSSASSKSNSSSSANTMTTTVTINFNVNTNQSSGDKSVASSELASLSKEVSSASSAAISNINYDTISTDCKLIDYPDDIDYHDIKPLYSQLFKAKSVQASNASASADSALNSLSKSSKFDWWKAYKVASKNYSIQDRDADFTKPNHPQVSKAMKIRNSLASGNNSYNSSILSSEVSSTNQSVESERRSMEKSYKAKAKSS